MPVSIRYRILCEVVIQHAYFQHVGSLPYEALSPTLKSRASRNYRVGDFLEIVPTAETTARLAGMNMRFKPTDQGFLIGIRVAEESGPVKPFLTINADTRLHFGLKVKDPLFFNYSLLPSHPDITGPQLYFFSNETENTSGPTKYLTKPVPGFLNTRAYEPGELYVDNSTPRNLFESIRNTGPAGSPVSSDWRKIPPDNFVASATYHVGEVVLSQNRVYQALVENPGSTLTNTGNWQLMGDLSHQYVNHLDKMALLPANFQLDLSGAATSSGSVRITALNGGAVALIAPFSFGATGARQVPVSMAGLPEGQYRIDVLNASNSVVPSQTSTFFLSNQAAKEGWLGIISLGPSSGSQAWVDPAGALLSPKYEVRFFNRATRWEYHFPKSQPTGTGAGVVPVPGKEENLVTPFPIPLTRFSGGMQLQADVPGTSGVNESVVLPLPEPLRLRLTDKQWYSDVFLTNLSL